MKQELDELRLQWLGGIFSIGGNEGFHGPTRLKGVPHYYPKMIIEDQNYARIADVQRYFGGKLYPHRKSYRLQLIGNWVADTIIDSAKYAPCRQGVAGMMQRWKDKPVKERSEFVQNEVFAERHEVPVNDYRKLVCLPAFVTGILQLRGPRRYFFSVEQGNWLLRDIVITTTDFNLLIAMQNQFGGNIPEDGPTKPKNSHKLYFDSTEARRVAAFICDFEKTL